MEKFSKNLQALPDGENVVRLYTDGSTDWRTRRGSWAYLVCDRDNNVLNQNTCIASDTTISRMEMTALIEALRSLDKLCLVEIVTDSEFLARGIIFWMEGWKSYDWKVANSDLWKIIYELVNRHNVCVSCVRGHSGVSGNEICDKLCKEALRGKL